MTFCAQCGYQMKDSAAFCPKCGTRAKQPAAVTPTRLFCAQCGTQLAAGASFCPQCGWRAPVNASAQFSARAGVTQAAAAPVVNKAVQALREAVVVFGGPGIAEVGEVAAKGETIISAWQGR